MPALPDPPIIALLTDMGLADWYVGTMKGVLHSICPNVRTIDICHEVKKQDVAEGAFMLRVSHQYFPVGTIFLCVVDPCVGSDRYCLVARTSRHYFIAPDNGLLKPVVFDREDGEIRIIENDSLSLSNPSGTFHGRDIFAPAAAHLACGLPFEEFGPVLDTPKKIAGFNKPEVSENGLSGVIIYVDAYGNLITNVPPDMLPKDYESRRFRLNIDGHIIQGLSPHYAAVPINHPLLYWGSSGFLEIGINHGSAAVKWDISAGEYFELEWS